MIDIDTIRRASRDVVFFGDQSRGSLKLGVVLDAVPELLNELEDLRSTLAQITDEVMNADFFGDDLDIDRIRSILGVEKVEQ